MSGFLAVELLLLSASYGYKNDQCTECAPLVEETEPDMHFEHQYAYDGFGCLAVRYWCKCSADNCYRESLTMISGSGQETTYDTYYARYERSIIADFRCERDNKWTLSKDGVRSLKDINRIVCRGAKVCNPFDCNAGETCTRSIPDVCGDRDPRCEKCGPLGHEVLGTAHLLTPVHPAADDPGCTVSYWCLSDDFLREGFNVTVFSHTGEKMEIFDNPAPYQTGHLEVGAICQDDGKWTVKNPYTKVSLTDVYRIACNSLNPACTGCPELPFDALTPDVFTDIIPHTRMNGTCIFSYQCRCRTSTCTDHNITVVSKSGEQVILGIYSVIVEMSCKHNSEWTTTDMSGQTLTDVRRLDCYGRRPECTKCGILTLHADETSLAELHVREMTKLDGCIYYMVNCTCPKEKCSSLYATLTSTFGEEMTCVPLENDTFIDINLSCDPERNWHSFQYFGSSKSQLNDIANFVCSGAPTQPIFKTTSAPFSVATTVPATSPSSATTAKATSEQTAKTYATPPSAGCRECGNLKTETFGYGLSFFERPMASGNGCLAHRYDCLCVDEACRGFKMTVFSKSGQRMVYNPLQNIGITSIQLTCEDTATWTSSNIYSSTGGPLADAYRIVCHTDSCADVATSCPTQIEHCTHPLFLGLMSRNCALTCGYCS